jgi:Asp-tRNA(Asn)/Glu-tRNA(Gln) amidotransferase A subunit family amidase
MLPMAHASDGFGSIRAPAACCGVVGLKPTRGRNTFAPFFGEGLGGVSTEHAVTLSIRDSAALLDATRGAGPGDPYVAPQPAGPYLKEAGANPGMMDDVNEYWRRVFTFSPFTVWFNLTGQPGLMLPLGQSTGGLPLAVQLVGRFGDEATLIRLGAQLEAMRPWFGRKPALAA